MVYHWRHFLSIKEKYVTMFNGIIKHVLLLGKENNVSSKS